MRNVANEIAADGFQTTDAGEILDEQKAAARMQIGNDNKLQILVAGGKFHRLALQLTCLPAASPGLDKLMMAHYFDNASICRVRRLKKTTRGGICKLDNSLRISDQNAICYL